ncbi:MAG: hypothetical protein AB7U48_07805, partial [Bauldia sp.]
TVPEASPPPRACPVCRSGMIAEGNAEARNLFRCDDCGCIVDLRPPSKRSLSGEAETTAGIPRPLPLRRPSR